MWRVVLSVLIGFASTASYGGVLEDMTYKGRAVPFYGTTADDKQRLILDNVRQGRLAEEMAGLVSRVVRLRADIGVGFASCGRASAFFDRQRSAIVICSEFIHLIAKVAMADTDGMARAGRSEFARTIDGAVWGVFFHELAHAIIHVNQVPITGREEDVADQFSLYFSTSFFEPRGVPVVQPVIWLFTQLAKQQSLASADQEAVRRLMADEHSLSEQRVFNLACWALGANAGRGYASAQFVGLPQARASRCSDEFATLRLGLQRQFQRYLKVQLQ